MENTTMTVPQAINAVIGMLEKVEVKGYANTSNIVHAQELLAKVAKFFDEEAKKQEEAPIELEPIEIDPDETAKE